MKLRKILLPVASVASIAAVVTPIVTSCGNMKSFESEFSKGEEYSDPVVFVKQYEAVVAQKEATEVTGDKAETYFADIEKNKQILIDDVLHNYFHNQTAWDVTRNTTGKVKISFGNISLKKENVEGVGDVQTMSFEAKRHYTMLTKYHYENRNDFSVEEKETVSFKCENVPVIFEYNGEHWHLEADEWEDDDGIWKQIKDFKVSMSFKKVTTQHMVTGDETTTDEGKLVFTNESDIAGYQWGDLIDFDSHYFEKIGA